MTYLTANPVLLTLLTSAMGILVGLIVGRVTSKQSADQDMEAEKIAVQMRDEEIAGEIYQSLHGLHHGLVETVRSYDSAVKVILDKLPTPEAKLAEMGISQKSDLALQITDRMENSGEQTNLREQIVFDRVTSRPDQSSDSEISASEETAANSETQQSESSENLSGLRTDNTAENVSLTDHHLSRDLSKDSWAKPIN